MASATPARPPRPPGPAGRVFKVMYYSRHDLGARGEAARARAVDAILAWSRDWNARVGITGALLVGPHHFAQVLEGPVDAVKSTFGRIALDPRHRAVTPIHADWAAGRDFGEWSMARVGVEGEADVPLLDLRPETPAPPPPPSPEAVLELLRYLAREAAAAAANGGG